MTQRQMQVSPFPGIPLLFGENEGAAPSSAVPDEAMEEAERPTVIKRLCQLSSTVIGHRSPFTSTSRMGFFYHGQQGVSMSSEDIWVWPDNCRCYCKWPRQ
jgi:hypothetical protein